jgi:glycerol-1-phosphate dehydrogenase [NAD(P)+]
LELFEIAEQIRAKKQTIVVCGGGRVIDFTKIIAHFSQRPYISIPTSASHDGFSSPYLGFKLRKKMTKAAEENPKLHFQPKSPIAIVGDTYLINKEPNRNLAAGIGDLVSKYSANLDWKLAHRITGEFYDEYAATFGVLSAEVINNGLFVIKGGGELATRLVVKALGNSGVSMSLAGNSRPASGSEHMISHYLDSQAQNNDAIEIPHGFQVGLATIVMLYLHGDPRWRRVKEILQAVEAPVDLKEAKIPQELFLESMMNAHKIRDRYTILGTGLTRQAAENAMHATEIL